MACAVLREGKHLLSIPKGRTAPQQASDAAIVRCTKTRLTAAVQHEMLRLRKAQFLSSVRAAAAAHPDIPLARPLPRI